MAGKGFFFGGEGAGGGRGGAHHLEVAFCRPLQAALGLEMSLVILAMRICKF